MKTMNKASTLAVTTTLFGLLGGGAIAEGSVTLITWAQWDGTSTNEMTDINGVTGTFTTDSGGAPAPAFDDFAFSYIDYVNAADALNVSTVVDYLGVADPDTTDANGGFTFELTFSTAVLPGTIIFLESLNREDLVLTSDGSFALSSQGTFRVVAPSAGDGATVITPVTGGLRFEGNSGGSRYGHFLEVTAPITKFTGVSTTNSIGGNTDSLYLSWASPAIPEPSSAVLLSLGALGFVIRRRR